MPRGSSASSPNRCSVSTCWDSTITAVPGHRRRISRAASRPSVVWVGGIRISASTTPGRSAGTSRSSRAAAPADAQAARQAERDRRGGVSLTGRFDPAAYPTLALPLAGGRGYWLIGVLTQRGRYTTAAGLRAATWPDGNQVATPRPAVVHAETDTFL